MLPGTRKRILMISLARRLGLGAAGLAVAGALLGCAGPGQYVWFDRLPPEAQTSASEYLIEVGDVVNIRVLGHDEMSTKQRVRSDGRLALLLIGEIDAKGKRPGALRSELEGRLKDYIVSPSVVVNIDETRPPTVTLLGEVVHPGVFPVEPDARLTHVLALGGGLTEYASHDSIFVVRTQPAPMRIRFTYDAISRNVGRAGDFPLHSGDVVEIE
jgi:polysaccharide export outer membrane protein